MRILTAGSSGGGIGGSFDQVLTAWRQRLPWAGYSEA
jgi:hypothetical protein